MKQKERLNREGWRPQSPPAAVRTLGAGGMYVPSTSAQRAGGLPGTSRDGSQPRRLEPWPPNEGRKSDRNNDLPSLPTGALGSRLVPGARKPEGSATLGTGSVSLVPAGGGAQAPEVTACWAPEVAAGVRPQK